MVAEEKQQRDQDFAKGGIGLKLPLGLDLSCAYSGPVITKTVPEQNTDTVKNNKTYITFFHIVVLVIWLQISQLTTRRQEPAMTKKDEYGSSSHQVLPVMCVRGITIWSQQLKQKRVFRKESRSDNLHKIHL